MNQYPPHIEALVKLLSIIEADLRINSLPQVSMSLDEWLYVRDSLRMMLKSQPGVYDY